MVPIFVVTEILGILDSDVFVADTFSPFNVEKEEISKIKAIATKCFFLHYFVMI